MDKPSPKGSSKKVTRRRFMRDGALYGAALGTTGVGPAGCGGGTSPEGTFGHGVASGDPLADRVILWTRVTQAATGPVDVGWEIARDALFTSVVASGTTSTSAARDYTVKVDATGLQAATVYHYRFRFAGELSPTGRTKTLPPVRPARPGSRCSRAPPTRSASSTPMPTPHAAAISTPR